jgi:hypothetical protein
MAVNPICHRRTHDVRHSHQPRKASPEPRANKRNFGARYAGLTRRKLDFEAAVCSQPRCKRRHRMGPARLSSFCNQIAMPSETLMREQRKRHLRSAAAGLQLYGSEPVKHRVKAPSGRGDCAWDALMAAAQRGDAPAYHRLLSEVAIWLRRYYTRRLPPVMVDDEILFGSAANKSSDSLLQRLDTSEVEGS